MIGLPGLIRDARCVARQACRSCDLEVVVEAAAGAASNLPISQITVRQR